MEHTEPWWGQMGWPCASPEISSCCKRKSPMLPHNLIERFRRTSNHIAPAAIVLLLVAVADAQAAQPADNAPPAKQTNDAGLKPGDVLGKDNWELAQHLLPPEILRHYQNGEYANKIIDWPVGIYKWDPQFKAATEDN